MVPPHAAQPTRCQNPRPRRVKRHMHNGSGQLGVVVCWRQFLEECLCLNAFYTVALCCADKEVCGVLVSHCESSLCGVVLLAALVVRSRIFLQGCCLGWNV